MPVSAATPAPFAAPTPSLTDWLSAGAAAVGALAAVATVVVAVIAAVYAARQWREAKTTREAAAAGEVERLQPYIQVWAGWSESVDGQVMLFVKNFGPTTATNVQISLKEPLLRAMPEEHPFRTVTIPKFASFPPGFVWRTWLDRWEKRSGSGLPMRYEGEVRYLGYNGSDRRHPVVLDLAAVNAQVYNVEKRLPDVIKALDGVAAAISDAAEAEEKQPKRYRDPASMFGLEPDN